MRIVGTGVDIVDRRRIQRLYARYPQALPRRILHARDWDDYKAASDKAALLAKRFAAKEAVAKSLGCGLGVALTFQDIYITHDAAGKPHVELEASAPNGWDAAALHFHLSLADEREYAIAYVIATIEAKSSNSIRRHA